MSSAHNIFNLTYCWGHGGQISPSIRRSYRLTRQKCRPQTQQHHPSCRGLDLAALLLSPVQRVPRYVLLLQQLLRHTPLQHGDHAPLQRVLQQLRTFLDTLNGSLEHSFQLVAVHVNARELDAR